MSRVPPAIRELALERTYMRRTVLLLQEFQECLRGCAVAENALLPLVNQLLHGGTLLGLGDAEPGRQCVLRDAQQRAAFAPGVCSVWCLTGNHAPEGFDT